jgi:hypothetical protein
VQGRDRGGDRVRDRDGLVGLERAVARHDLAQRRALDPLPDYVGPVALVDGVVDADEVGVDDPARGDGGRQHLGGRVATGIPQHNRYRTLEDHVGPAPELATEHVVADVLLEPVPLGQYLTDLR